MSCCCCVCLHQTDYGILERFGRFVGVLTPGFNWICWPFSSVAGVVTTRQQIMEIRDQAKTADNVFVQLRIIIKYSIPVDKVDTSFYGMKEPLRQITNDVENIVRSRTPDITLEKLFTEKDAISTAIRKDLSSHLADMGYHILDAQLVDIQPPNGILEAMNKNIEARRMREVLEFQAETDKLVAIKKAEADNIVYIKKAEAEAESKRLQGEGVAAQRKAILKGLEEGVRELATVVNITPEETMKYTFTTQYFDMLREIGTSDNKATIFIPHMPSAANDMANQFKMSILEAHSVNHQ
jgi:regulator of protease activity HflC (stomatin/prohibitin superfamily)